MRARPRTSRLLIGMGVALWSTVASAQAPSCDHLPFGSGACLPWGYTDLSSVLPGFVTDLSADGSVLVGETTAPEPATFRWKRGDANDGVRIIDIGIASSGLTDRAHRSISADGRAIVGTLNDAHPHPLVFYWSPELNDRDEFLGTGVLEYFWQHYLTYLGTGTIEVQGFHAGTSQESFMSMSYDGTRVVGMGEVDGFFAGFFQKVPTPYLWRAATDVRSDELLLASGLQGMIPLAISGDGEYVVGRIKQPQAPTPSLFPVRYRVSNGTSLFPWTGTDPGEATVVNFDGSAFAGWRDRFGAAPVEGFRWQGGYQPIGAGMFPASISDDGNTIGGCLFPARIPWVWDSVNGSRSIDAATDEVGIARLGTNPNADPYVLVSGDGTVFSVIGAKSVAKVTPLSVVVMGDSFSSGEGAGDYRTQTDVAGLNECHRSANAYATMMRPRGSVKRFRNLGGDQADGEILAAEVPGFSWHFLACSGARTANMISTTDALVPGQWGVGQIEQLKELSVDPDFVVLTIGGNDALFGPLITRCAKQTQCQARESDVAGVTWRERVQALFTDGSIRDAVGAVLGAILATAGEDTTLLLLGYPQIVPGMPPCVDLKLFGLGLPGTNEWMITEDEQNFLRDLTRQMNDVLEATAAEKGVHFERVDWAGHEACGVEGSWITEIMEVPFSAQRESLHPTREGQVQYAAQIDGFLSQRGMDYSGGFYASGMPKNP